MSDCDQFENIYIRMACKGEITPHQSYWLRMGENPEDHPEDVELHNNARNVVPPPGTDGYKRPHCSPCEAAKAGPIRVR